MIDRLTIDRIFNSVDIVDVVGDYVSLKRRGANYLGLCPFHNEKTPSFTVSPSKGIYKCFGCGKGGNAVNFIMDQEGLSYPETLKFLAKRYNIEVEEKESSPEELKKRDQRESLLIVTRFAGEWFAKNLFETQEGKNIGLSYFKERGFTENTIRKFELGYSPAKRDAFTEAALKKGFQLDFLNETGLSIVRGDWKIDRFAERVMFPIHSLSGQVIAFGGRTMRTEKKIAKYLNSPESEIYHKSRVLYGIYQARKAITSNNNCILVEGYTDVISLNQAGIENVVASSGTSLTTDQVKIIKRFTSNLTVLYDGDAAGIKASLRGIDIILEEEMSVKVCLLPEGEDPDSFARQNGAEAVSNYIEKNAVDFIRFKTNVLLEEAANDPVKKAGITSDIVQSIAKIPDGIMRSVYLKETSGLLEIDEKVLYTEVNKIRRKQFFKNKEAYQEQGSTVIPKSTPQQNTLTPDTEPILYQFEREIIWLLMEHGSKELYFDISETDTTEPDENSAHERIAVSAFILDDLNQDGLSFSHPVLGKIFDELLYFHLQDISFNEKYFYNHEDPEIVKAMVDISSKSFKPSRIWSKHTKYDEMDDTDLTAIIERLLVEYKIDRVQGIIKELSAKLKDASLEQEERTKTLMEIAKYNQVRINLGKSLPNRIFYW
ncbi:MAG: DNA primase [Salinivirgaceae bacterium]